MQSQWKKYHNNLPIRSLGRDQLALSKKLQMIILMGKLLALQRTTRASRVMMSWV